MNKREIAQEIGAICLSMALGSGILLIMMLVGAAIAIHW
tara:strand:- start:1559 stop:1675 length:117 start_codon:yes stop_codon:yes gene_type:complete